MEEEGKGLAAGKQSLSNDATEEKAGNKKPYAVLYTSGSTGRPKGARITHLAVLNRLTWQWETFPYQTTDVCVFKVRVANTLRILFEESSKSLSRVFEESLKSLRRVL